MTMINVHPGDTRYVKATFKDAITLALVDPPIVKGYIKSSSGAASVFTYGANVEMSKVSTGVYKLKVSFPYQKSAAGVWTVNIQGLNSPTDSVEVESIQFKVAADVV